MYRYRKITPREDLDWRINQFDKTSLPSKSFREPYNYCQKLGECNEIIGRNTSNECPGGFRTYYQQALGRNAAQPMYDFSDKYGLTQQPNQDLNQPRGFRCYLGTENDKSYLDWVEEKLRQHRDRQANQQALGHVTQEIRELPGHWNAARTETSNQSYGQYLDLLPRPPGQYLQPIKVDPDTVKVVVSFRKSNISDHKPAIDRHFFVYNPQRKLIPISTICLDNSRPKGSPHHKLGFAQERRAHMFHRNAPVLGELHGSRKIGCTFPLLSKTGLEINRPA